MLDDPGSGPGANWRRWSSHGPDLPGVPGLLVGQSVREGPTAPYLRFETDGPLSPPI